MQCISRRHWLLMLTLMTGVQTAAVAQGFPDRPIKLVVPFGAGSAVDRSSIRLAHALSIAIAPSLRRSGLSHFSELTHSSGLSHLAALVRTE